MITIIDYNMGNVGSIKNMLKKVGTPSIITRDKVLIEKAEKLILPGVGAFDKGMDNLKEFNLIDLLNYKVKEEKTPILGICLGMQLLCRRSEEGKELGLGWIAADTIKFQFDKTKKIRRIPHMGWNNIQAKKESILLQEMPDEPRFYFVHSYHVVCDEQTDILATSKYGFEVTAAVEKGNVYGAQFHPEKSHKFGKKLLENFSNI